MKQSLTKYCAFTLVELLVALLLSTLILTALFIFFVEQQKSQTVVEQQLIQQERQRFVAQQLHDGLRHAGYIGCASLDGGVPIINHGIAPQQLLQQQTRMLMLSATDARLPSFLTKKVLPGGDVLWERQADVNSVALQHVALTGDRQLSVDNSVPFKVGESLIVADCLHAELFSIVAVEHAAGDQLLTLNAPLYFSYASEASLRPTSMLCH